jgi:aldehyde dehydrogenase (NAD+)
MTAYKKVSKWAAPDGVPFDINTFALRGKVFKDPQGVALIIGPFNYPLVCVSSHSWGSQVEDDRHLMLSFL